MGLHENIYIVEDNKQMALLCQNKMLFFNLLLIAAIVGAELINKIKQTDGSLEGDGASNSVIDAYEEDNKVILSTST